MQRIKSIFAQESTAGILLLLSTLLAVIIANSKWQNFYFQLLNTPIAFQFGTFTLEKTFLIWINEGLMSIFFFTIGLEIKRAISDGSLSTVSKISFPLVGALGGMVIPALIYIFFNYSDPVAMQGFGIPIATDTAFALCLLTLLGKKVPKELKVFLVTLAILDDIGAIIIIAIFYSHDLSMLSMVLALAAILVLAMLHNFKVTKLSPYLITGILLWFFVLKSGVHATLAGIILAFFIPYRSEDETYSPLLTCELTFAPWTNFLVLPLFALANAGFDGSDMTWAHLLQPIPLGIAMGLFVGKQIGIFGACWLLTKFNSFGLPKHMTLLDLYCISLLCGIGFTMSLFIGGLAFLDDPSKYISLVKLGVLSGSVLSGLLGFAILKYYRSPKWQ